MGWLEILVSTERMVSEEKNMNLIQSKMQQSPIAARVFPLLIFVVLTCFQDSFGEAGRYWIYFAKTLAGVWLIWMARPLVAEMRWAFSWEAVVVGIAVFAMWVGLDGFYPHSWAEGKALLSGKTSATCYGNVTNPWNPLRYFGEASLAGWFFVVVRTAGSALVVPPLEEVFYRSFLYRFVARSDFQKVPLSHFSWTALLVTSALFGFAHHQWLAGILCGLAYQWLVIRKGRLGDAMTAHGITNFLLAVWIVWKGDWKFW